MSSQDQGLGVHGPPGVPGSQASDNQMAVSQGDVKNAHLFPSWLHHVLATRTAEPGTCVLLELSI